MCSRNTKIIQYLLVVAVKDVLEILDLSYNNLSGMIPLQLGDFNDALVQLRNNSFDT
jgi:hypothetical protein